MVGSKLLWLKKDFEYGVNISRVIPLVWGCSDTFPRQRLLSFVHLVRNKKWLPKQDFNSNKHRKEKEEESSRTGNRKMFVRWESIRQQEWQWADRCGENCFGLKGEWNEDDDVPVILLQFRFQELFKLPVSCF